MQSTRTLRRAAIVTLTTGLAAVLITSFMAASVAMGANLTQELVCVDHLTGDSFSERVFLPPSDEIVTDIAAEGGVRVRGDEQWTICTEQAPVVAGATAVAETDAGESELDAELAPVDTVAEATAVAVTPPAVTPPAVQVETTTVQTTLTPVVAGVSLTAAPEAVAAPASIAGATVLPRAGGFPVASGLLAGLGLLLSVAGMAARRITR